MGGENHIRGNVLSRHDVGFRHWVVATHDLAKGLRSEHTSRHAKFDSIGDCSGLNEG